MQNIPALIDTGATASFISTKLIHSLQAAGMNIQLTPTRDRVVLADNKSYKVYNKASFPFTIESAEYLNDFHILTVLNRPVVLGLNFLRQAGAKLQFSMKEELRPPRVVRAIGPFTIDPTSERTVTAQVMALESLEGKVGITNSYYPIYYPAGYGGTQKL